MAINACTILVESVRGERPPPRAARRSRARHCTRRRRSTLTTGAASRPPRGGWSTSASRRSTLSSSSSLSPCARSVRPEAPEMVSRRGAPISPRALPTTAGKFWLSWSSRLSVFLTLLLAVATTLAIADPDAMPADVLRLFSILRLISLFELLGARARRNAIDAIRSSSPGPPHGRLGAALPLPLPLRALGGGRRRAGPSPSLHRLRAVGRRRRAGARRRPSPRRTAALRRTPCAAHRRSAD